MGQSAAQLLRYLRANASSAQQAITALPETNILTRNNATKLNPSTFLLHGDQTNKEHFRGRWTLPMSGFRIRRNRLGIQYGLLSYVLLHSVVSRPHDRWDPSRANKVGRPGRDTSYIVIRQWLAGWLYAQGYHRPWQFTLAMKLGAHLAV